MLLNSFAIHQYQYIMFGSLLEGFLWSLQQKLMVDLLLLGVYSCHCTCASVYAFGPVTIECLYEHK